MSGMNINPLELVSEEDQEKIVRLGVAMGLTAESSELVEKAQETEEEIIRKNNTVLKQSISGIGAVTNVLTRAIFGSSVQFPLYQGTAGYKLDRRLSGAAKGDTTRDTLTQADYQAIPQDPSAIKSDKANILQKAARVAVNIPLTIVNPLLFTVTGTTLPTFKQQPPANWAKSAYDYLNKGWNSKSVRPFTSAVESVHKRWTNFLKSKSTYHTITFGVTALTLAAMGPPGWGIAAGITAFDVTRGTLRVNRIREKSNKLNHLVTLHKSREKIKNLEKELEKDERLAGLKALKPETNQITDQPSALKGKRGDELNKSVLKGMASAALKESVPVGVAVTKAVLSPGAAAVEAIKEGIVAIISFASATQGKLGEQNAKDMMDKDISTFQSSTGVDNKISKYELAQTAYQHALYEKVLELARQNPSHTVEKCKEEAAKALKGDPRFTKDKMEEPKSIFAKAWRGFKASLSCTADYLHPFKEATSYKSSYENCHKQHDPKTQGSANNHTVDNTRQNSHSVEHSRQAEQERESLQKHSSHTNSSAQTPPPDARTHHRDQGHGM